MRERLHELWLRIKTLRRASQLDHDLDDEMAFHLEMREASLREEGVGADAARDRARRQFGNTLRVKESLRELWGWSAIERAFHDVRFGARLARREKSFTTVVVLTLALGIGATTAMFTIVDAVVLRPIQLPAPHELVVAWEANQERNVTRSVGSVANYLDWQEGAASFTDLGAFEIRTDNRTDGAEAEQIKGGVATSAFFRALRIQPTAGRLFRADEDLPANRYVAMLGHDYWRSKFVADLSVIGRPIVINGEPHEVIGIMPPLRAPFAADIWRPMAPDRAELDRGDHNVIVVGRLRPGTTMTQAETELQTIAGRLALSYPETNRGWSARVESLYDAIVQPPTRRSMVVLMGAVAVLLLIACVNVANLMLARGARRQREISTRLALGASRGRVAAQLLAEAGVLSILSAGAGLIVAIWGLRLAEWVYPQDIAGAAGLSLNAYALAFAAVTAIATTFAVSVAPALLVSRERFGSGLIGMTRTMTDAPRAGRLRNGLVVMELALALVLLVGAGLLIRSVGNLRAEPLGFVPDGVVTGKLGFYSTRYEAWPPYVAFIEGLVSDLEGRPGIVAAGVSSSVPFDGGYTVMQVRLNGAGPELASGVRTDWRVIGGNYLAAMGIPLTAGRGFTAGDNRERALRSTIINESLAERLWPGQDPLGRQLLVGDSRRPYEVIGVTPASRMRALGRQDEPAMYFHYLQFPWASMTLAARVTGSLPAFDKTIRSVVATLDREQPVSDIRLMTDVVSDAAAAPQMNASMVTVFAAIALALAAIGIYGLMSYAAAQRTNEIGIRLALGARPLAMFSLIWLQGLRVGALGLAVGAAAAMLAGQGLGLLLYEVSPFDPITYSTVFGLALTVTIVASYLPARRAMRIEAASVLRHE